MRIQTGVNEPTLGQSRLTTGRLAQNGCASTAENDGLRVREDGGNREAAYGTVEVSILRVEHDAGYAPGHFTSIKYEFGDCTKRLSLCLRASAAAEGLRRSTARVWWHGGRAIGSVPRSKIRA